MSFGSRFGSRKGSQTAFRIEICPRAKRAWGCVQCQTWTCTDPEDLLASSLTGIPVDVQPMVTVLITMMPEGITVGSQQRALTRVGPLSPSRL